MTAATDNQVLIRRVFNAPRELVFQAWTDPRVMEQWHAPRGCTIEFQQFDFRVGGTFRSCIHTPSGYQCWCKGEYLEIVVPERIVYSMTNCDAAGREINPAD